MKIGVFDSGKGGEFVAERLRKNFPHHEFVVVNDAKHVPYGDRNRDGIIELTDMAIQPLLEIVKIIVIACNTATAAAIDFLRAEYPDKIFIGFEPAIKPAVIHTKFRKIMILATPATLKSVKYLSLKERFARDVEVFEPDCAIWAEKIEKDEFADADFAPIVKLARDENTDEIVLGCTHYLAVENKLRELLPHAEIVEPTTGVVRRLATILQNLRQ